MVLTARELLLASGLMVKRYLSIYSLKIEYSKGTTYLLITQKKHEQESTINYLKNPNWVKVDGLESK